MSKLFLSMLLLWSCYACNTADKPRIPHADKPQPELFSVNTDRDTVLLTGKGARIHIPANAIRAEGNQVQLEVTEVYDVGEMLASGIQTVSDHQLLSSGGMINIRPAGNATALILQPIRVEVPTPFWQEGMMHYTGSTDEEGNINWTNPEPLPQQKIQDQFDKGRMLLEQNCYSCHSIDKRLTGPALLHVTARRDWKWLYAFIRNSEAVIASGDLEASCLYVDYNMAAMTKYPALSDNDLESICLYIDQVSKQKDLAGYYRVQKARDTCQQYLAVRGALLAKRNQALYQVMDTTLFKGTPPSNVPLYNQTPGDDDARNVPGYYNPVYYDMVISAFGWHNLDMLLKNMPGVGKTRLTVTVKGAHRKDVQLFLVIPELRVTVEGAPLDGKADTYSFDYGDEIRLPLNRQAWIVAMGETGGKTLFAKTGFSIQLAQQLIITPEVSKRDVFNKWLKTLGMKLVQIPDEESLNVVDVSRNDSLLRKQAAKLIEGNPDTKRIDAMLRLLQALKPVGMDCGCDMPATIPDK
ncbi:cytochrome c [Chitinophaga sp. G-6-1-13]|uniref:Cytochrome c n=1 Tax=Chitinophaga fulva TaxID=2728842 RepID=A0A848GPE4_9BACT|nr:cytochrome c [Chitinophaga fulva]NML39421.1 cytochrome c [Chitinophaga fulva]